MNVAKRFTCDLPRPERVVAHEDSHLPRSALTSAVAKFILFKIRTDRRVRERIETAAGKPLSAEDAHEFAADMIDVAKFYDIPLDMLFLNSAIAASGCLPLSRNRRCIRR